MIILVLLFPERLHHASGFYWNSGLRETAVTDTFLFLSTFFIQSARHIVFSKTSPVNMFMARFFVFLDPVYNLCLGDSRYLQKYPTNFSIFVRYLMINTCVFYVQTIVMRARSNSMTKAYHQAQIFCLSPIIVNLLVR